MYYAPTLLPNGAISMSLGYTIKSFLFILATVFVFNLPCFVLQEYGFIVASEPLTTDFFLPQSCRLILSERRLHEYLPICLIFRNLRVEPIAP